MTCCANATELTRVGLHLFFVSRHDNRKKKRKKKERNKLKLNLFDAQGNIVIARWYAFVNKTV